MVANRRVTFAFHKIGAAGLGDQAWQTRMAHRLTGEYAHVDVMFEDGYATSIRNNEVVFFEKRNFENPEKKILQLTMRPDQYNAMRAFATQTARQQTPFNNSGFYRCALPLIWRRCDDAQFFCSEYALRLLQQAGYLREYNAGQMNPTLLMKLIAPNCAAASPPPMLGRISVSAASLLTSGPGIPKRSSALNWIRALPTSGGRYSRIGQ
jgi:hypothetical protein